MTEKQIQDFNKRLQDYADAYAAFIIPHYLKKEKDEVQVKRLNRQIKALHLLVEEYRISSRQTFKREIEKREDGYDRAYLEKLCWTKRDIRYFRASKEYLRKQKII